MYWHESTRVTTIVNIMARDGCFALQNVLYCGDTPFEKTTENKHHHVCIFDDM